VAVALGALLLAAGLGLLARRRRNLARLGFAAISIGALAASLRDPLVEPLLAVLSAAAGLAVALWTLDRLLALATPPAEAQMPSWSRRRFIGSSLSVAGLALAGGTLGRLLVNGRSDAESEGVAAIPDAVDPVPPLPAAASLSVAGITPLVTPNPAFYRIDTTLFTPRLDAATWSLTVDGMVDRPFSLAYDELLAMEMHEQYVTIACVSNEVGGELVGNALWKGARLRELLDRAGVQPGATQIVGRSYDGWTCGFPTAWLDQADREALVAVAMNGEPLPAAHGFPARLIVPGLYGYVSATKWLTQITLTTLEGFDAYWVPLGWAKQAPILTQSRIDVPFNGARVPAGTVAVAGVAWAPDRGVSGVEVQVDDAPWAAAELSAPISDTTWVQFVYRWQAAPGQHMLRVRATDGEGTVQTDEQTRPAPSGARGRHTIGVTVE
jgi:DMSO/TMAO reductase YedYZ molybdopterin-dependent catalytic subunit